MLFQHPLRISWRGTVCSVLQIKYKAGEGDKVTCGKIRLTAAFGREQARQAVEVMGVGVGGAER